MKSLSVDLAVALMAIIIALTGATAGAQSVSKDKIALGETLFFDKRLSTDRTTSCATCHDPATAFTNKDAVAAGIMGRTGTRNVPTIINAKFSASFFWDGRAGTLEEQVKQPLLNAAEMGLESEAELVARLSSIPDYVRQFRRIFPKSGITLDTVAGAIAAYERTLVSFDSPFDRFIKGNRNAISDNQKAGWDLFREKAKCIECHAFSVSSPHFTDFKFYNTGAIASEPKLAKLDQRAAELRARKDVDASSLAHDPEFSELGRFLVTRDEKDIGAFKTPALRNVELTGPYMHDGSLKTLLDVVRFYNEGGRKNPHLHHKMQPLYLNEKEVNDLVEFLRALTSDDVLRQVQSSTPQTRTAPLRR